MTLSEGGASAYSPSPLLALHDFISHKAPPISYAYSCNMSIVGEEDEEEDNRVPCYHSEPSPSQPPHTPENDRVDTTPGPKTRAETSDRSSADGQGHDELHQPLDTEIRPQITQRETFPQTSKRPNWQMIRFQTMPGRSDKEHIEAWIGGWSAAVAELGDDTYCACADSTATADERSPSRPAKGKTAQEPVQEGRTSTCSDDEAGRGRPRNDTVAPKPTTARPGSGAVSSPRCHNCSRQPSPAVVPDDEFVFGPTTGAGKMMLKCKLVWKSIVDRVVRRPSPRQASTGGEDGGHSHTPLSRAAGGVGGYDDKDDADYGDEVDIDELSASSRDDDVRRPYDDIAERQARLRRAQMLLKKSKQEYEGG